MSVAPQTDVDLEADAKVEADEKVEAEQEEVEHEVETAAAGVAALQRHKYCLTH